jgi:hypothetical protein
VQRKPEGNKTSFFVRGKTEEKFILISHWVIKTKKIVGLFSVFIGVGNTR